MALEREKNKLVLDKCQSILTGLLKDEDNKYCVDCDAKSPRWASWNLGIFLCIRCAGIHRNLGVHISKVKSVNLDTWTPQQVACIQQMGNSRARAVYEANLQDNFRRPQTDSSLEQFIRAKYEAKKYIAREWVPPALPHPTWDSEIEKQLKKKKEKKSVTGNVEFPVPVKNSTPKSGGVSPKPLPKAPGGRNNSPNQAKRASGASAQKEPTTEKETLSSGTLDLLGLDVPSNTNGVAESDADIFGDFLTAPSASATAASSTASESKPPQDSKESNQNEESNFFNQKLPDNASAEKLSRDSILALYNQTPPPAPHSHPQPPQQNIYGSGGMFMGAPGMPVGVPPQTAMGAIPPQQQQQAPQNMMFFQQQAQSGAGMQSQFYSAGLPGMGGAMYQGMPGMTPGPAGMTGGVQLSAANPFAQIQAQMGNISLGGMVPPQTQPPPMVNPLLMANTGLSTNPQATTLSTNLWQ